MQRRRLYRLRHTKNQRASLIAESVEQAVPRLCPEADISTDSSATAHASHDKKRASEHILMASILVDATRRGTRVADARGHNQCMASAAIRTRDVMHDCTMRLGTAEHVARELNRASNCAGPLEASGRNPLLLQRHCKRNALWEAECTGLLNRA